MPLAIILVLLGSVLAQENAPPPDVAGLIAAAQKSRSVGDFARARATLEEAWRLVEKEPQSDPRRYDVARQLFSTLSASSDLDGAETYLQIAINWREINKSPNAEVAADLMDLALLCRARHDYERGLLVTRRITTLLMPEGGIDTPVMADVLSLSGILNVDLKRHDSAVPLFEMAIKVREQTAGTESGALLPDLDRLGSSLLKVAQYARAEQAFRRSLAIRERLNGGDAADLIPSLDGLAYSLFGQKKFGEAEPVYKRLLTTWEVSAGAEHPMVALTLDKIAVFYKEQERWDDRDVAASRANALRALALAGGLAAEGDFRLVQGEKAEAEGLYRRALAILDPQRSEHQELRAKLLDALKTAPRAPRPPQRRYPKSTN